jgi:acyl-CoA thioesterase
MGDLSIDTKLTGGNGRYQAHLSRDWEIWGPNGGYLAVMALRAAGAETRFGRPATFSCHFLNVAEFDAVDLEVTVLREAKRAAALRVSMTQGRKPVLECLVWAVDEGARGLEHDVARMPDAPKPAQLKSYEDLEPEGYPWYPFWNNIECRPLEWSAERVVGAPTWQTWIRYRPTATFDDPFVDAGRALLLIDTMMWPAANGAHINPRYLAPSIEVTAQFHRAAAGAEWLLCDTVAPIAAGGLIGSDTRIWSEDGRLLASGSGQLLCRPNPFWQEG